MSRPVVPIVGVLSGAPNAAGRGAPSHAEASVLQRYLDGVLSAEMTLMYWLKAGATVRRIEDLVGISDSRGGAALQGLRLALAQNRAGCEQIQAMVSAGVDSDELAPTIDEGIAFCRHLFDWSVQQSPESSVALYSLGSPELLAEATHEIVEWMDAEDLLPAAGRVLDIGCGIGRFEAALSSRVGSIQGIDVSGQMIQEAGRRCAGMNNVELTACDGYGLDLVPERSVDLVLAVDAFPYLFQSGWSLLERHFIEAQRVLRDDGCLCVFELSYGRSIAEDMRDFMRLSQAAGLRVERCGLQPFQGWDGIAFTARRTPARSSPTQPIAAAVR